LAFPAGVLRAGIVYVAQIDAVEDPSSPLDAPAESRLPFRSFPAVTEPFTP
jgi:hypothetical protein